MIRAVLCARCWTLHRGGRLPAWQVGPSKELCSCCGAVGAGIHVRMTEEDLGRLQDRLIEALAAIAQAAISRRDYDKPIVGQEHGRVELMAAALAAIAQAAISRRDYDKPIVGEDHGRVELMAAFRCTCGRIAAAAQKPNGHAALVHEQPYCTRFAALSSLGEAREYFTPLEPLELTDQLARQLQKGHSKA